MSLLVQVCNKVYLKRERKIMCTCLKICLSGSIRNRLFSLLELLGRLFIVSEALTG